MSIKITKKAVKLTVDGRGFGCIFETRSDERGYTVRVKNLPEIITGGLTLVEAKKMAKEAIVFCLAHEYRPYSKSKGSPTTIASSRV